MRKFVVIIIVLLFELTSILYAFAEELNLELAVPANKFEKKENKVNTFDASFAQQLKFSILPELLQQSENAPKKFNPKENESIIYIESQYPISAINPKKIDANIHSYPGLRGPNQLVVYTPKYGDRTGTNEFGTESIVIDNMVVSINGSDSIIPLNGFVISGHGKAKTWIMKNIQIGTKVYIDYDNNNLICFLTPDSLMFAAKQKIKEVNDLLEYYRKVDVFYNDKKADDYLETSKDLLRKAEKKPEKTQVLINEAMENLDNALRNAIPYSKNELKGVWVRPVETTPELIEKTIDNMHDIGISDIFLETFFHGKTIYKSDFLTQNGVISQREEFQGLDPLDIWIKEAHKRKMRVHIWFECFYVGNDNPQTIPNHILSLYPEWSNKRRSNYDSLTPVTSLSEHNGYFLDPSNPQVTIFLLGILNEIVTKYDIDGINLDYIRYPQTVDASYSNYALSNWGYTMNARSEFKSIYGIDPIDISYGTIEWELWCLYRQNKITEFVKNVKNLTNSHNITLTTVIFPNLKKSLETKMQNWALWSIKNYVDGVTPLILTGDKNTAVLQLMDVANNIEPKTKIYSGIFVPFMGGNFEDLLLQLHKSREFKSSGSILFDYAHINDKYTDALKTRIYNHSYDFKFSKRKKEHKFKSPKTNKNYKPEVRYNDKSGRENK